MPEMCPELSRIIYDSAKTLNLRVHERGTYVNMEGPAFSTLAESNLYRSWGMDLIGMTNFAEAKLAREAEMCYASLAAVTDYDCWHPDHASVSIDMIIDNLHRNGENAKKVLALAIRNISSDNSCRCQEALKHAIVTEKKYISSRTRRDLGIIIGKYVK